MKTAPDTSFSSKMPKSQRLAAHSAGKAGGKQALYMVLVGMRNGTIPGEATLALSTRASARPPAQQFHF